LEGPARTKTEFGRDEGKHSKGCGRRTKEHSEQDNRRWLSESQLRTLEISATQHKLFICTIYKVEKAIDGEWGNGKK